MEPLVTSYCGFKPGSTGFESKDFMNQKLFDGVEDLPREVSEVQAIAIVPSLRQLRRSLLESSVSWRRWCMNPFPLGFPCVLAIYHRRSTVVRIQTKNRKERNRIGPACVHVNFPGGQRGYYCILGALKCMKPFSRIQQHPLQ